MGIGRKSILFLRQPAEHRHSLSSLGELCSGQAEVVGGLGLFKSLKALKPSFLPSYPKDVGCFGGETMPRMLALFKINKQETVPLCSFSCSFGFKV